MLDCKGYTDIYSYCLFLSSGSLGSAGDSPSWTSGQAITGPHGDQQTFTLTTWRLQSTSQDCSWTVGESWRAWREPGEDLRRIWGGPGENLENPAGNIPTSRLLSKVKQSAANTVRKQQLEQLWAPEEDLYDEDLCEEEFYEEDLCEEDLH